MQLYIRSLLSKEKSTYESVRWNGCTPQCLAVEGTTTASVF